jgi:hypothetical protein
LKSDWSLQKDTISDVTSKSPSLDWASISAFTVDIMGTVEYNGSDELARSSLVCGEPGHPQIRSVPMLRANVEGEYRFNSRVSLVAMT